MMFRTPDLDVGVPGGTFGTAVTRFGRTSFTLEQVVFKDGLCAAKASATMVLIEKATGLPQCLPDRAVARLSRWAANNDIGRDNAG